MVQGEIELEGRGCAGEFFFVNLSHAKVIREKQAIKTTSPLNQEIDKPVEYFIN